MLLTHIVQYVSGVVSHYIPSHTATHQAAPCFCDFRLCLCDHVTSLDTVTSATEPHQYNVSSQRTLASEAVNMLATSPTPANVSLKCHESKEFKHGHMIAR